MNRRNASGPGAAATAHRAEIRTTNPYESSPRMNLPNSYRPGDDPGDITRPIVGQILATMAGDGSCSLLDLAEAAHIPPRDLAATFGGQRELGVTEFLLIAQRLGVRASTLIPRADLERYVADLPGEAQR